MSIDRDELLKNHTIFPRSFLKEVQVVLSYPSIEGQKNGEAVNTFLADNFNINSDYRTDQYVGQLSVNADIFSYQFDASECRLSLSAVRGYESFEKSVLPYTKPLAEFGRCIAGGFGTLGVGKENIWIIETENPDEDLMQGLSFIINPERVLELPKITVPKNQNIWGISTETRPEFLSDTATSIKLKIDFSDKKLTYRLIYSATTKENISYESFKSALRKLNMAIYYLYMDMVSDNVLELMMKGE